MVEKNMSRIIYGIEATSGDEIDEFGGFTFDLEEARCIALRKAKDTGENYCISGYEIHAADICEELWNDSLFQDPNKLFLAWFFSSSELVEIYTEEIRP